MRIGSEMACSLPVSQIRTVSDTATDFGVVFKVDVEEVIQSQRGGSYSDGLRMDFPGRYSSDLYSLYVI